MRGEVATITDIELDLDALVMPVNLLSEEILQSSDDEAEEESLPYRIDSSCFNCGTGVRLTVYAVALGLRLLEQLLLDRQLSICCPGCARNQYHGRQ